MPDEKFSYEIIRKIGDISVTGKGWTKELNLISWNGRKPKYDIREWSPDRETMGKGVTFTEEELDTLRGLICNVNAAVSIKEESPMSAGSFINFLLSYDNVSKKDQAEAILQKGRELIQAGATGVGITYSANYGQTCNIEETYDNGDWYTGTTGANQAAVMCAMETLMMSGHQYIDLQGKLRIFPITTMNAYEHDRSRKPWNDQVHLEIVRNDLQRIKMYLEEGWDILGWQNQDTVNDTEHPYAVGGGVVKLVPEIDKEIQKTLIQYAKEYSEKHVG